MSDVYLLGDQECLKEKRIAVVGTRQMSAYGEEMTEWFVTALVKNGWCIVSGLARGVDKVAHETCLSMGGQTIAVLAHGLDHCYPPEHTDLRDRIVEEGGLLVSAYAASVGSAPERFRERDVLMAKLSYAVLVIEAPRKSGTKITVGGAAEAGINVYVVPGPITQESYHGSVEIMRNGGIPVYNPQDLLRQLDLG